MQGQQVHPMSWRLGRRPVQPHSVTPVHGRQGCRCSARLRGPSPAAGIPPRLVPRNLEAPADARQRLQGRRRGRTGALSYDLRALALADACQRLQGRQ